MTIRHSTNNVLDAAVDDHEWWEQDRRAVRALKQGLGNPPSAGRVMREEARFFLRGAVSVLK